MTDSIDSIQNQFFASPTLANLAIKLFFVVVVLVVMKILLNLAIRALNLFSNRNFPHISSSKKTTVFSVVESLIKFTIAFIGVTVILNLFGINTSSIIATAGIGDCIRRSKSDPGCLERRLFPVGRSVQCRRFLDHRFLVRYCGSNRAADNDTARLQRRAAHPAEQFCSANQQLQQESDQGGRENSSPLSDPTN